MAASGDRKRPEPKIDLNETYYFLLCADPEQKEENERLLTIIFEKANQGSIEAAEFGAILLKRGAVKEMAVAKAQEEKMDFAELIKNTCLQKTRALQAAATTKEIYDVLHTIELPKKSTPESEALKLSVEIAFKQLLAKTHVKSGGWCCQFNKEVPVADEKYYCAQLAMYTNQPIQNFYLSLLPENKALNFLREAANSGHQQAEKDVLQANILEFANKRISLTECVLFLKKLYELKPRYGLQNLIGHYELPNECPGDLSDLAQKLCDKMQNKVVRVNFLNQLYRLCDASEEDAQEERKLANRALLRRALIALKGTEEELFAALQAFILESRGLETAKVRYLLDRYAPLLRPAATFRI